MLAQQREDSLALLETIKDEGRDEGRDEGIELGRNYNVPYNVDTLRRRIP